MIAAPKCAPQFTCPLRGLRPSTIQGAHPATVLETEQTGLAPSTALSTVQVGGRLAADEAEKGPTWQETLRFAMWLLSSSRPELQTTGYRGAPAKTDEASQPATSWAPAEQGAEESSPSTPASTGGGARLSSASPTLVSPATTTLSTHSDPLRRSATSPPAVSPSAAASPADAALMAALPMALASTVPTRAPPPARQSVEQQLGFAQHEFLRGLYPGMRQMNRAEWRLYWARVHRAFERLFTRCGRQAWAETAAADARAKALRAGLSSARQREAASSAIKLVSKELKQLGRASTSKARGGTQTGIHNRASAGR